jgi:hypothetical protein
VTILPGQIKEIPDYAFTDWDYLESIIIPEGIETIGDHAFDDCMLLKIISMPSTLKSIGGSNFNLSSLVIILNSNQVVEIDEDTFPDVYTQDADELFQSIIIVDDALLGAYKEANYWSDLANFIFAKNQVNYVEEDFLVTGDTILLKYIGDQSTVVVPAVITEIGMFAFAFNLNVENVILPEGITKIGYGSFMISIYLKSIQLPSTLKEIKSAAFVQCMNLSVLDIPASVETIGDYAFYMYSSYPLAVIFHGSPINISANVFDSDSKYFILVPDDLVDDYKESDVWSELSDYIYSQALVEDEMLIEDNVLLIYLGSDLEVTVHDGVVTIGEYAFSNKSEISEIILPDSVTTISSYAFKDCKNLVNIDLGDGLEYISSYAFENCKFEYIHIPGSIQVIETKAFWGCNEHIKIYIHNTSSEGIDLATEWNLISYKLDYATVEYDGEGQE